MDMLTNDLVYFPNEKDSGVAKFVINYNSVARP